MSIDLDAAGILLSWNDEEDPLVVIEGNEMTTVADLANFPVLSGPEMLGAYCEAVNHLSHGSDYRVIHDPAEFAARYLERVNAEDPNEPWREGVVRIRDFGICDTSVIEPPQQQGDGIVFFVEDEYLGIPYRVAAPAPGQPGEVTYEPVSVDPAQP